MRNTGTMQTRTKTNAMLKNFAFFHRHKKSLFKTEAEIYDNKDIVLYHTLAIVLVKYYSTLFVEIYNRKTLLIKENASFWSKKMFC